MGFDDGGNVLLQCGAPQTHFMHESLAEAVARGSVLLLRALLQQMGIVRQASFLPDVVSEERRATRRSTSPVCCQSERLR
mmetsp:Transcript_120588/g.375472  ORF Transcript_120588/g.375472 Transcript_120588/m.375472 type:complete len:80 (+) Transcript_120588:711-950(+)